MSVYRFGEFVLDDRTRQLLRDGEPLHLSPKAFHLLQNLIDNRHRAVSKTELQQALWPATFVADTNLASLIREVRQALDDTADTPRFVRTVHRFGYWFIGEIRDDDVSGHGGIASSRCWLVWSSRQIPIESGEHILGRAPDASVWVDAPGVSRHHARLVLDGQEATVEDLGSKNGTFVGNEPVTAPRRLNDGDTIRLGPVVMTFRVPPPVGLTDTVALD